MRLLKIFFALALAAAAVFAVAAGFVAVAIGALAAAVLAPLVRRFRRPPAASLPPRHSHRTASDVDAIEVTAWEVPSTGQEVSS